MMDDPRWLPLESNPESFNRWSASLGLDTSPPNGYHFTDIWGLDPELLAFVKQPVKAVLMLFPVTKEYEDMRTKQDQQILEDGVEGVEDVIYFKQTIANACGTFALLHTLANTDVPIKEGPLTELFERCKDKSPLERAQLLVHNNDLERVHTETAHTGQTAAPALEDSTDLHFVTFVAHNGFLIELDGRRNSPVNHGPLSDKGLLDDAVQVVKRVMELTGSIQFNLVALSPAGEDDE
ncbi:hypothetical protein DMC30DRAFT_380898 [Rhodotorula diobovata]|uniref:Ubiquitin carboxyl-terminal hydrolase n=1 Tax=Rhodotorula diobovata TaxID=5288 RepID=A0A5C5FN13_9BASI|nr:hypothetical protein DMC30DRAFT_380898 [Rhodotorula diobovata]